MYMHVKLKLPFLQGFVKQYREELTNLDSKGHEMNENYRELLVCC